MSDEPLEAAATAAAVYGQLEKLATDHEAAAQSIRATMKLLAAQNGHGWASGGTTIELQNGDRFTVSRPAAKAIERVRPARREATAKLLAEFDRKEVATLDAAAARAGIEKRRAAIGVLVHRGYLKRKGGGFLRTAKEFVP